MDVSLFFMLPMTMMFRLNKSIALHSILQPIEKAVGEYGIKNATHVIAQTDHSI